MDTPAPPAPPSPPQVAAAGAVDGLKDLDLSSLSLDAIKEKGGDAIASMTETCSVVPMSAPPNSSGIPIPNQPSAPISRHSSASKPVSVSIHSRTSSKLQRPRRNSSALLAISSCSSLNAMTSVTTYPLSRPSTRSPRMFIWIWLVPPPMVTEYAFM